MNAGWTGIGSSAYGWQHFHQGGRLDSTSGWYHFRHRDYSPTLGRWTAMDPISYRSNDNDLYRYSFNNPAVLLDPFGLEAEWADTGEISSQKKKVFGNIEVLYEVDASSTAEAPLQQAFRELMRDNPQFRIAIPKAPDLIAPVFYFRDKKKDEDCGNGKGRRVWVQFVAAAAGKGSGADFIKDKKLTLHQWTADVGVSSPAKLQTTKIPYLDSPGLLKSQANKGEKNVLDGTLLVGIVCQCKTDKNAFLTDMLDWVAVAFSSIIDERGATAAMAAIDMYYNGTPNPWSIVGGEWLNILNKDMDPKARIDPSKFQ
jgi:RHS repeat-associated protein